MTVAATDTKKILTDAGVTLEYLIDTCRTLLEDSASDYVKFNILQILLRIYGKIDGTVSVPVVPESEDERLLKEEQLAAELDEFVNGAPASPATARGRPRKRHAG